MTLSLISTYIFTNELDAVLASRADLSAEPFSSISSRRELPDNAKSITKIKFRIESGLLWVKQKLEAWTAAQDDTQIAWTLGIGWACCGGGLAGMCLVFAKAAVKLITGSLSHENSGNQFGHLSSIFTFIFLAVTAVSQIICLNRGLRVYDSTLVVPVFYGVYTATGFVDSLVFNNSVDAYQTWTLFLIFVSIVVLISGVVLLTLKKPEKRGGAPATPGMPGSARSIRPNRRRSDSKQDVERGDGREPEAGERELDDDQTLWEIGVMSDDEDGEGGGRSGGRTSRQQVSPNIPRKPQPPQQRQQQQHPGEEGRGLIGSEEEEEDEGTHLDGGFGRRSPVPSLSSNTAVWR